MARVLVVDDEERIRSVLSEFLAMKGYQTLEAATGAGALQTLREWRPHVMLLDVRLPDMDGLDVLRQAKALDPAVGVFMVTGLHDEAVGREALQAGAFDYITKPFDLRYLEQTLWYKLTTMTLG